jgi:hypothetical protein
MYISYKRDSGWDRSFRRSAGKQAKKLDGIEISKSNAEDGDHDESVSGKKGYTESMGANYQQSGQKIIRRSLLSIRRRLDKVEEVGEASGA